MAGYGGCRIESLVANGLSEVFAWTTDFWLGDVFKACYQAYILQGKKDAGPVWQPTRGGEEKRLSGMSGQCGRLLGPKRREFTTGFFESSLKYSRVSSGFLCPQASHNPVVRPHTA